MSQQLRTLREEMANADLNLEKIRQKSAETNLQNQEILTGERRRRLEAEEDVRLRSEVYIFILLFAWISLAVSYVHNSRLLRWMKPLQEIRSLRDELMSQRNGYTLQIQKKNSEISKLKLQLSASTAPSNEVDSRITSLTQTLVLKQQALECLTTERNALRLQLEKVEVQWLWTILWYKEVE